MAHLLSTYHYLISFRGLIGFVFSQSPELVAPYGSYEPIFGTNPFSIGIPTKVHIQECGSRQRNAKC